MYHDSQDTIVALSSPSGSSLDAIIRISGPDALYCAKELFIPETGPHHDPPPHPVQMKPYQSLKGNVHLPHEQTSIPSTLYLMKAPYSYTKEDVVEIHTFGSPPLLDMILETLISLKNPAPRGPTIRLAQPGEFTKRAFLHGRIDLTQAEAVIALIRSRTDAELKTALARLKGNVSKKAKEVQQDMITCCAEVEASIDFSDQDIEFVPLSGIIERLRKICRQLDAILSQTDPRSTVHPDGGVTTVLCGRPNAGKSSLFNALLRRRQAIVTPVSGTTRDVVEGLLELGSHRFRLLDTAGLMKTGKEIESLATAKTYDSLQASQLLLILIDGSKGIEDEDIELLNSHPSLQKIIVMSKCDIAGTYRRNTPPTSLPDLPEDFNKYPLIKTSAITGEGLEELKDTMVNTIREGKIDQSASDSTLNARHRAAFKRTLELAKNAKQAAEQAQGHELIAIDLRDALETLGSVAGETTTEDVLEKIFSNFCIGK